MTKCQSEVDFLCLATSFSFSFQINAAVLAVRRYLKSLSTNADLLIPPPLPHNNAMERLRRKIDRIRTRCRWSMTAVVGAALCAGLTTARADDRVTIELVGTVEPECGFSSVPAYLNLGSLTQTGSQQVAFGINCNTPFAYRLRSQEGGLRHPGAQITGTGFLTLIPYRVEVQMPTNAGQILDRCTSQSLVVEGGCQTSGSGNGVAINQTGSLLISWSLAGQPVAGTYSDVLTLEVYPQY